MRFSYRKPIVKTNDYQLESALEGHFADSKEAQFLGFGIGSGWNDLVFNLHSKLLQEHPDYYIVQVKEKFATLRYYTGPMTDRGMEYIHRAEDLSAVTCEECGRPGRARRNSYWIVTLCDVDSLIRTMNGGIWRAQKRFYVRMWKTVFSTRRLFNRSRSGSAEK